jgi:tetratricopeptide (TPR) repeat protein
MAMIQRLWLCWGICWLLVVPARAQDLTAAKTAYEMGDYARAIDLYENLRAIGIRDGTLYYNLAVAYHQAGLEGQALLNALRAQEVLPRDGAVQALIALLRAQRAVPQDETDMLALFANATKPLLTLSELYWLCFALWCLVWFLGGLARRTPRLGVQISAVIATALCVVMLTLLASRWWMLANRPLAVVTTATTALSGAGADYLTLFRVAPMTEVWVIEPQAEWLRIALPDGRQGWLPRESLITQTSQSES